MQAFQYIASAVFLEMFILTVFIRAALLRRKEIRTIMFGATDKTDFLLVPFALAIAYTILANSFSLPLWKIPVNPFWKTVIGGWVRLVLSVAAVVGMIFALISFDDSFRVGIMSFISPNMFAL